MALKAAAYEGLSRFYPLPGRCFGRFGRKLALRNFWENEISRRLLLNPVSSTRYFEFDFAYRQLIRCGSEKILDISSPFLFGLFLLEKLHCEYVYTNLDSREFSGIKSLLSRVNAKGIYQTEKVDATAMPYADDSFDVVISISVIEHIPKNGDIRAIEEMWRVLRPGGRMILTVPTSPVYKDEYRDHDVYSVGVENEGGRFFFQRYYDDVTLEQRILSKMAGANLIAQKIYGEREHGFFRDYEQRWIRNGLDETIKDPWLMARHMTFVDEIQLLQGFGVIGLCVQKNQ